MTDLGTATLRWIQRLDEIHVEVDQLITSKYRWMLVMLFSVVLFVVLFPLFFLAVGMVWRRTLQIRRLVAEREAGPQIRKSSANSGLPALRWLHESWLGVVHSEWEDRRGDVRPDEG